MADLSLQTFTQLTLMLEERYGFSGIDRFQPVKGGYVTKNFRFESGGRAYFLKQYETENTHRIHDLTSAMRRFSEGGIPIITPVSTVEDERVFLLEDTWWSVSPFIEGKTVRAESLDETHASALGAMLGRLHLVGVACKKDDIDPVVLWNREIFNSDRIALEYVYAHMRNPRDVDTLAIGNIRVQAAFLDEHPEAVDGHLPPNDCLIHGDFTHNNVFFDERGHVKWIFDLDKTCVAPRAYEVSRSVLITCFDHGWDEKSFRLAHAFLRGYTNIFPLSFTEFDAGFRTYIAHFMHMTWLEKKILLRRSQHHEPFVYTSHRRLTHLIEEFHGLTQRLYP